MFDLFGFLALSDLVLPLLKSAHRIDITVESIELLRGQKALMVSQDLGRVFKVGVQASSAHVALLLRVVLVRSDRLVKAVELRLGYSRLLVTALLQDFVSLLLLLLVPHETHVLSL